ncbi:hypothetical protein ACJRO7_018922 [Eucalyptus globulus]|uniref:Secreted protein n=1 Tax=Eucalyptus globulus TaxID=34317 RepID=A0ABD3KVF5_EUCGL
MTMRPVAAFALGAVFGAFVSRGFHHRHDHHHHEGSKRGWPCPRRADKEGKASSADPGVTEATAMAMVPQLSRIDSV